jgi:hypothetical protein
LLTGTAIVAAFTGSEATTGADEGDAVAEASTGCDLGTYFLFSVGRFTGFFSSLEGL